MINRFKNYIPKSDLSNAKKFVNNITNYNIQSRLEIAKIEVSDLLYSFIDLGGIPNILMRQDDHLKIEVNFVLSKNEIEKEKIVKKIEEELIDFCSRMSQVSKDLEYDQVYYTWGPVDVDPSPYKNTQERKIRYFPDLWTLNDRNQLRNFAQRRRLKLEIYTNPIKI